MAHAPLLQSRTALASFSTPQRFRSIGYVVIFLTFGVMGGWAAIAKIDSASVASGVVALEGDRQIVQHLEGGIVEKIMVREADSVEQGDTLVILVSVEARSNLERVSNRYTEQSVIEARLLAEREFESSITFPETMLTDATPELLEVMRTQDNILSDRLSIFSSQTEIGNFQIDQLQGQITGLEQQQNALERRLELHSSLIDRLTQGQELGVVVRNSLAEKMDTLIQIEAALGETTTEISQVGVRISEARLNLLQSRQQFLERANVELQEVRTQLTDLGESMKIAEDTFLRSVIRAPSSGTVQNVTVTTEGSVIGSGEILMEIVPQDDKLLVLARISPSDVDNVSPGQQAEVRFSSFNTKLTPVGRCCIDPAWFDSEAFRSE